MKKILITLFLTLICNSFADTCPNLHGNYFTCKTKVFHEDAREGELKTFWTMIKQTVKNGVTSYTLVENGVTGYTLINSMLSGHKNSTYTADGKNRKTVIAESLQAIESVTCRAGKVEITSTVEDEELVVRTTLYKNSNKQLLVSIAVDGEKLVESTCSR